MPLELIAAASVTDSAIHKEIFGSGLIFNEKTNGIFEI